MRPLPFTLIVAVGALIGLIFAAFSTYDSMIHLDRQVHGIHCSYLPGLVASDTSDESGCHATLMSPYSSVLRDQVWGGIPVALPGMSVFAFLLFWSLGLILARRQRDRRAAVFLLLATLVPAATSVVMGYLALVTLDAACKTCIGIYVASGIVLLGSVGLLWSAWRSPPAALDAADDPAWTGGDDDDAAMALPSDEEADPRDTTPDLPTSRPAKPMSWIGLIGQATLGGVFVFVPLVTYATVVPSFDQYLGSCGTLAHPEDPHHILVPLGKAGRLSSIQVLDPLCPSCRAFERRLESSKIGGELQRKALLFPLDTECNWMLDRSLHPGACAVSEAVLCASDDSDQVLSWAFDEQERLLETAREDQAAVRQMVAERFPELSECLGSAAVKARINQSLRWAVRNQLPLLSPQLYVDGVKLCDEDTDLGLDYMLTRLITKVGGSGSARPGAGGGR
jgi:uncharacterized membrane protein